MAQWHPVDTLLPTAWLFPKPGTETPFAEIRYLPIKISSEPVWCFRAVRVDVEPRQLVGRGYFQDLEAAAMACHSAAMSAAIRPELNRHGAYENRPSGTLGS